MTLTWTPLSQKVFFENAKKNVRVIWTRRLSDRYMARIMKKAHIQTRQVQDIRIVGTLRSLLEMTYLPYYKDNKEWFFPDSENLRFWELVKKTKHSKNKDWIWNGKRSQGPVIITTAYLPTSGTRLVLDGIHRAVAIINKLDSKEPVSINRRVHVYEIVGDLVFALFPFDFARLMLDMIEQNY